MKKLLMTACFLLITQTAFSATAANHIAVGDRVIDQSNNTGTVREVFSNGMTKIRLDGVLGTIILADRPLAQLSKGQTCIEDACVGDRIIDLFNFSGTITEVFSNGQTKVRLDGLLGNIALADRSLNDLGYNSK